MQYDFYKMLLKPRNHMVIIVKKISNCSIYNRSYEILGVIKIKNILKL
ncbi:hypothetical protein BCD96_004378 [Clostridium beijerinckii]|nr:hypothetical protein [Clostridium beijerinckii]NRU37236.1 hypothetical protein [Clostridium beijerinckii]NSA99485.1 hypothetical protein [Clostridium beijerinckii]OOM64640.1 hypothetical protein CLOBI_14950 [Clostridium beijerinckii]OOM72361.1 hypothetical protein CLBEIC_06870 [Clostridium beijerinckii]